MGRKRILKHIKLVAFFLLMGLFLVNVFKNPKVSLWLPVTDSLHHNKKSESSADEYYNSFQFSQGLIVDWFQDIAVNPTTYNIKWHPLFPNFPVKSSIMTSLTEHEYIKRSFSRRIYGFLIPEKSAVYDFEIGSRDGLDILILEVNNICPSTDCLLNQLPVKSIVANITFSIEEMKLQDKKITYNDIFTKKLSMRLKRNKLYFIDILQGGNSYGRINIQWRQNNSDTNFQEITKIYHSKTMLSHKKVKSFHKKITPRYAQSENELHRMEYYKLPPFAINDIVSNLSCDPFTRKHQQMPPGKGVIITETWATYPDDLFGFYRPFNKNQAVLNFTEAQNVVRKIFDAIEKRIGSIVSLKYQHTVQVQKNFDHGYQNLPRKDQFYFVEFDVEIGDRYNPHRVTTYVQMKENDELCFRNDFVWNVKSKIYIITPVRNQAPWVHYLTHSIGNVIKKTGDKNVELILVDYNSTDANYSKILSFYDTPYKYVYLNGHFNRVAGINTGLKYVDENSIAFVLDLHIELPANLFDKIRKHTLKGISAYGPTVLKVNKGHHEQYTLMPDNNDWEWVDPGYGLMSMYKSDWTEIGGMNEKLFSTHWGGEDWEFVDRLLGNGYYSFHSRLPRFYHIHHSKEKMWDAN